MRHLIGAAVLLLAGANASHLHAHCTANELTKLLAADPATSHVFGGSAAIHADVIVIGAWADDDNGRFSGSAYVFRRQGPRWIRQQKLLAPDGGTFDYFGASVGVWGEVAIIGAPGDDSAGDNAGSAYIYRYDGATWYLEQKLYPTGLDPHDHFGNAVAIAADTVVIGSWTDSDAAFAAGSAYVFSFDGSQWVEQAKLIAPDAAAEDWFGYAVAIGGDTIVLGAPFDDDAGSKSGSAYVFVRQGAGWVQQAKLVAPDGAEDDRFGSSVALDGDTIAIGAWPCDVIGPDSGAVYIFRRQGSDWMLEQKLSAADGAPYDNFGYSVAIRGDLVAIGAVLDDDHGTDAGSAYVFARREGRWVELVKLLSSARREYEYLGCCAALDADTAVLGAWSDDDQGRPVGLGYVFGSFGDCNANATLDICDLATGASSDFNHSGLPDECEDIGDLNCDGAVDFADINPFVYALANPAYYVSAFPNCQIANGDINGDGTVDIADINPFIWLLSRGP